MKHWLPLAALSGLWLSIFAHSAVAETHSTPSSTTPTMTRAQFDTLMQELSNWGRWGEEDELGTLNLITPQMRVAAAALVREGISVSLALDMNKTSSATNPKPFKHQLIADTFGGHSVAGDIYQVEYHGFAHSHIDGLPHYAHKGMFYNGVPYSAAKSTGAERLGVQNMGKAGLFSRGVLIDMPLHLGVPFLAPGTAITIQDLENWERKNKVRVGSGDVLLLRTGRWVPQSAPTSQQLAIAGLHASVASWLKARDVAVIGSDAISDVMPSGIPELATPLHELLLVGLGMPIMDNLNLEELADISVRSKRVTFLFSAAPLRVTGGTGSPLNPLAIF